MRRPKGLFRKRADVSGRGSERSASQRPKEIFTSPKFHGQLAPEDEQVELILKRNKDSKKTRRLCGKYAIQIATRNSKAIHDTSTNDKERMTDDSHRTIQTSNSSRSNKKGSMNGGSFRTKSGSKDSLRAPSTRVLKGSSAPKAEDRTLLSFDEEDRDTGPNNRRDDDIRASIYRLGHVDDDDASSFNSEEGSEGSSYLREIYEEEKKRERYIREMVEEEKRLQSEQNSCHVCLDETAICAEWMMNKTEPDYLHRT